MFIIAFIIGLILIGCVAYWLFLTPSDTKLLDIPNPAKEIKPIVTETCESECSCQEKNNEPEKVKPTQKKPVKKKKKKKSVTKKPTIKAKGVK